MITPCTGFQPQSLRTLCSILIYTEGMDLSLGETVWRGIRAVELQFGDCKFNPYPNRLAVFGIMLDIPSQNIHYCVVLECEVYCVIV